MHIGVLGAGRLGGTLARRFVAAGHEVAVAGNHDPLTLQPLVARLGGHVHPAAAGDAVRFGDLLVLAVPFGAVEKLPTGGAGGKVVVDATNYEPARDGHRPLLDTGAMTSTEMVQACFPTAKVVKAFNSMRWDHLRDYGHLGGAETRYGLPVSGNDPVAKRAVFDLVEQLGFEPVDAGELTPGGLRQQPGGDLYDVDLTADQLHARLGAP
jgi:predicted dinucleotide-binding enzyme